MAGLAVAGSVALALTLFLVNHNRSVDTSHMDIREQETHKDYSEKSARRNAQVKAPDPPHHTQEVSLAETERNQESDRHFEEKHEVSAKDKYRYEEDSVPFDD